MYKFKCQLYEFSWVYSFDVLTAKITCYSSTLSCTTVYIYNLSKMYRIVLQLYHSSQTLRQFPADIPHFQQSIISLYCCLSLEIHLRDLQQLRKYEKPNKNIAQTAIVICISTYKIIYPKTCYRESNPLLLLCSQTCSCYWFPCCLPICECTKVRKYRGHSSLT